MMMGSWLLKKLLFVETTHSRKDNTQRKQLGNIEGSFLIKPFEAGEDLLIPGVLKSSASQIWAKISNDEKKNNRFCNIVGRPASVSVFEFIWLIESVFIFIKSVQASFRIERYILFFDFDNPKLANGKL